MDVLIQVPNVADLKSVMASIEAKQAQISEAATSAGIPGLEAQIVSLQEQIQDKRIKAGIVALEQDLEALRVEYEDTLKGICQSVTTWTPDKVSKGKAEVWRSEGLKFIRRSRTVREIRASEFFETFPFLAPKIAKVTLKDARMYVNDAELDGFVGRKVSYTYEIEAR